MSFEGTDLLDQGVHTDDPEPFYAWLRDECPLYYDEANELWAVSRYEDVMYVSKHTEMFDNSEGAVPSLPLDLWPDDAMINKVGDAHTRQRGLVSKGFSPRRIADMEGHIREVAGELVYKVQAAGKADLVRDMARPLPMLIIGEMLGYPRDKIEAVLDWTDVYTRGGDGPMYITEEVNEAFANFCEFHEQILEQRKQERGTDLISIWLDAELDGHKLEEDTILFEHNLLLVGGSETTRNAISAGMNELMRHRDQQEFLVANLDDQAVVARAMEEMIRWSCPFTRMKRVALQDVQMHGKTIKQGEQIIVLYPAANRDPRAYDEPNRFDIARNPDAAPLSFGYGKHFCLGAALARMEAKAMIEAILRKLPDIRHDPTSPPVKHRSSFIRGFDHLPVVFTPAT